MDLLDGTPVIDIKPWVPNLDVPGFESGVDLAAIRIGWYAEHRVFDAPSADRRPPRTVE
ncbi:hypothetical protein BH20ACT5_BH20ACT5_19670 [soil metagenome]